MQSRRYRYTSQDLHYQLDTPDKSMYGGRMTEHTGQLGESEVSPKIPYKEVHDPKENTAGISLTFGVSQERQDTGRHTIY